jgi:hypothetical protein
MTGQRCHVAGGRTSPDTPAATGGHPGATRSVLVRIDGLRLASPNQRRGLTRLAAIGHSRRVAVVKQVAWANVIRATRGNRLGWPDAIHVTRIGERRLDADNLIGASKTLLDGIAKAIQIDDRAFVIAEERDGIRVTFGQRSEGRGVYAVEVELRFATRL